MIRKSLPSGFDPMGGYRFSEKIMLHQRSGARQWFNLKSSRSIARNLPASRGAIVYPLLP
jgi:hypothetical protein